MLKAEGITKQYAGVPVLRGASLSCARGSSVCLAGANATGKTTFLTIAAGLQKADSGSIQCDGRIGLLPQEHALLDDMCLRDNLLLWYAAAGKPKSALFAPGSAEELLHLSPFARRKVRALSGGIKKRASLACMLAADPDFLLMDEPFAALDLQSCREMGSLLRTLQARGKGLLFSSHNPQAIAQTADDVVLLRTGTISAPIRLPEGQRERERASIELLCEQN